MKIPKLLPITLGISFIFNLAQAQTGWESGAIVSAGASTYVISSVQNTTAAQTAAKSARDNLSSKFYYSVGGFTRKYYDDMYGFEFGVHYSSFAAGPKNFTATDLGGNTISSSSTTRHTYIDVPLRFVFKKDLNYDMAVGAYAGVAPAYLIESYTRNLERFNNAKNEYKDYHYNQTSKFNMFVDVGVMFRYVIIDQLAVDIKPFIRVSPFNTYRKSSLPMYDALLLSGGASVSIVWIAW